MWPKKSYDKSRLPRKITKVVQFCILQLVLQYPGIKLRKIKSKVNYLLQVELDEPTICRFFQSQGLIWQMKIVVKQRWLWSIFAAEMAFIILKCWMRLVVIEGTCWGSVHTVLEGNSCIPQATSQRKAFEHNCIHQLLWKHWLPHWGWVCRWWSVLFMCAKVHLARSYAI